MANHPSTTMEQFEHHGFGELPPASHHKATPPPPSFEGANSGLPTTASPINTTINAHCPSDSGPPIDLLTRYVYWYTNCYSTHLLHITRGEASADATNEDTQTESEVDSYVTLRPSQSVSQVCTLNRLAYRTCLTSASKIYAGLKTNHMAIGVTHAHHNSPSPSSGFDQDCASWFSGWVESRSVSQGHAEEFSRRYPTPPSADIGEPGTAALHAQLVAQVEGENTELGQNGQSEHPPYIF